jgi:hypothetical protein
MNTSVLTEEAEALFDEYAQEFHAFTREPGAFETHDYLEDLKAELHHQHQMHFAGRGDARFVFRIPDSLTTTSRDLVVKLPLSADTAEPWRDGHTQNETEIELSRKAMVDTTHMAPVRAFDDTCKWVVMDEVEEFRIEDLPDSSWQTTLRARFEDTYLDLDDLHESNLGWLPVEDPDPHDPLVDVGRRLVVCDYGMVSVIQHPA